MNAPRYQVRIHGLIFCLAAMFGLVLFVAQLVERGQLFFVTIFLSVFGEVVLATNRYLGSLTELKRHR
jgi:hypothetical protein